MSVTEITTPRGAAEALARVDAIDPVADAIAKKVRELTGGTTVKDVLSGTWFGHTLHPVLTDLPIGTWTSAVLLDWLGGKGSEAAADRLLGIGLAAAAPTFASGWLEYADSTPGNPTVKRIGLVHAFGNGGAAALFAASLAARRQGARGRGRMLALAGSALLSASGYLGGHLSFANGVGVNRTAFEQPEAEWSDVLGAAELADDAPGCVEVDGTPVLVVRHGGELFALSDTCAHRGGALHEGKLSDGCIVCPLHGSTFRLRDGGLVRGPSAYPQPAWEARERSGRVEVRPAGP
jgi:nitrite reductase/ring-hydroxylating ferredoxin subunit/uncharacterized membrane protein